MTDSRKYVWLLALALLGVPGLFALVDFAGYKLGYFPSEASELVVFGLCVLGGMSTIFILPITKRWVRIVASLGYGVVMCGVLLLVTFWVACANGNCI